MESNNIRTLIHRYYEGQTSLSEEKTIAEYFANESDIPADLVPTRAMFEAMGMLRDVKATVKPQIGHPTPVQHITKPTMSIWLRYAIATGVAACAVVGLFLANDDSEQSSIPQANLPAIVCYVDGEYVDNQNVARSEADKILADVSNDVLIAMAEIDKLGFTNR